MTGCKKFLILFCLSLTFLSACRKFEENLPQPRKTHVNVDRPRVWSTPLKMVVIVLENTDYAFAVAQPYLGELTKKGALLTNYSSLARHSQPNYIAMIAGSTFGVNNENLTLDVSHLGDLLEQKGKTWKNYAEGYPGNCFLGTFTGEYVKRHVPFLSMKNIQENPARCARVVSAEEFRLDLKNRTLPDFSLYVPNLRNDGHDTGVAFADQWLSGFLRPILEEPETLQNTVFVVTFDEVTAGSIANDNRVLTVFFGTGIRPGSSSGQEYDHYSLLRTIEAIYDLPNLGRHDQEASPIDDIWQ